MNSISRPKGTIVSVEYILYYRRFSRVVVNAFLCGIQLEEYR
ncbi:hypothetical protein [Shewanella sp. SR44-4]|nr:hypothetical protein [Shewanella sp. SR44-4]